MRVVDHASASGAVSHAENCRLVPDVSGLVSDEAVRTTVVDAGRPWGRSGGAVEAPGAVRRPPDATLPALG